jgi:hypothetical protein
MKVFNLTDSVLDFHKKLIPSNGGVIEVPELDKFIPKADQRLADKKVLAFGRLPDWWNLEHRVLAPPRTYQAQPVDFVTFSTSDEGPVEKKNQQPKRK